MLRNVWLCFARKTDPLMQVEFRAEADLLPEVYGHLGFVREYTVFGSSFCIFKFFAIAFPGIDRFNRWGC